VSTTARGPLRVRWLGRVAYADGDALQRGLHDRSSDDYLLLLEHPHVYTLGTRADMRHVLAPPASVGAALVHTDRGGDVTYHGPGQLVGYPIVTLPAWRDGMRDVVAYVRSLERVLVDALLDLGVNAGVQRGLTGVWVGDEKVAAIGVKVARGRTRHGFALNVDPDLAMFDHIVPCGIAGKGVTSLARLLGTAPPMGTVVDTVVARFADLFGYADVETQLVTGPDSRHVEGDMAHLSVPRTPEAEPVRLLGRLAAAGVDVPRGDGPRARRPEWMRVKADFGDGYRATRRLVRDLGLHTVCEEAGCPNIYECWADGTATFMILGERCTRACGFCLVDTRHPLAVDVDEPVRVAEAVATLGLRHAVVTSVARDDLDDGGAEIFAATIRAMRARTPQTRVEVLIPDCKGDPGSLDVIFDARPDVLNHNLETVARLQRAARPSAGYARSLAVLARAKDAELHTKSGLILGMGEELDEVRAAITDLRGVGVDILTVGQYLQPSSRHLPVVRWWTPDELAAIGAFAEGLGFAHVEAGPLVRSSYHARRAVDAADSRHAELDIVRSCVPKARVPA
jgi:lipoic acid synthetase